MGLTSRSLFLYGFHVTEFNRSIDFDVGGAELQATVKLGFYSLASLMVEIARAMNAVDPERTYTATANRAVAGGLENRVTIGSSGVTLNLRFATGTRAASSVRDLMGFPNEDKTGATNYTGSVTAGKALAPERLGYNYVPPEMFQELFGKVNISASGVKESIVYNIQRFWQVQFKYESEASAIEKWSPFFQWAINQRILEFTPNISDPSTVLEGTLEKTEQDSNGLAFRMIRIPKTQGLYKTGLLTFRVKQ